MEHQQDTYVSGRRGFLRGLLSLPLIGGGVTFIGQPTAAAVPVTPELLESYNSWLALERRYLMLDLYGAEARERLGVVPWNNPGSDFFWHGYGEPLPTPSTRAATVLATVGCALPREG